MSNVVRHVLGLSGGKDSAALALYMRDRIPQIEYFFCDTKMELAETYKYLDRLEGCLGKPIVRLNAQRGFEHWLGIYRGYLPSSRMRWCTKTLKIRPFEEFVGEDQTFSYIAIRADEDREGYVSHKPNIIPVFPFKEDGKCLADIHELLEREGLGLPEYYEWRTRSGCYFCFFQRKIEWVGLLERHPDLFKMAMTFEKVDPETGLRYTWCQKESLEELSRPERVAEIKKAHLIAMSREARRLKDGRLCQVFARDVEVFANVVDDDDGGDPCTECHS
jgi:3'-phosphoadenosine 5'-phosphosulfate sulfotransferase (PAPS reductase)/FAD synthetase